MGAFKTQNESGANLLNQHQTVDCDECGREVSKLWRRHKGTATVQLAMLVCLSGGCAHDVVS